MILTSEWLRFSPCRFMPVLFLQEEPLLPPFAVHPAKSATLEFLRCSLRYWNAVFIYPGLPIFTKVQNHHHHHHHPVTKLQESCERSQGEGSFENRLPCFRSDTSHWWSSKILPWMVYPTERITQIDRKLWETLSHLLDPLGLCFSNQRFCFSANPQWLNDARQGQRVMLRGLAARRLGFFGGTRAFAQGPSHKDLAL